MKLYDLAKEDLEILAKRVKRKPFTLYRIGKGLVQAGPALCVLIEKESGGLIRKEDLRPDIFNV